MQVKKQQLELNMEQQTDSKSGKEYVKAVYCHAAYLSYMQNTSWEMLDWMKCKLESRLPEEISITSDIQMTPPFGRKQRRTKEPLLKVKEKSEKVGLNSTFRKLTTWHLVPSLHGKWMGKQRKQWQALFSGAPKSLQVVTAAMKLKDACSLEEKLWPT